MRTQGDSRRLTVVAGEQPLAGAGTGRGEARWGAVYGCRAAAQGPDACK
jgi:hypothetical protein